jgi:hypothetical protein
VDAGVGEVLPTPAFRHLRSPILAVVLEIRELRMAIRSGATTLLLGLAFISTAGHAHHSAAQFDFAQTVRIEGVVKEMRVANPHIALLLEVTDDKGTRVIEYEGHSRNNVYRRGWRPEMVHTGDKIAIDIAPMRTGDDGGYVKTFILKDGTEF